MSGIDKDIVNLNISIFEQQIHAKQLLILVRAIFVRNKIYCSAPL